jgi:tRNA (guanine37-N1)-methyltransferase
VKFSVVTILPELIAPFSAVGVVGRACQAGVIAIDAVNPRDFTHDRHRTVDDTPYGGGPGMVMKVEPVVAAIEAATSAGESPAAESSAADTRRILLTPSGAPLTQAKVRELARHRHLVLVCGRYEGVDERVRELAIDDEISVGDFVLSGGELGALVIIDAVARLIPGVLGEATSVDDESFSSGLLEYPQYTRPATFRDLGVPEILGSGNHAAIAQWRLERSWDRTARRRPDLWRRHVPALASGKSDDKALARALSQVPAVNLAARTWVALVHHPVVDREGQVVTTALTNLDVHDIARSASTYGLGGYAVVTPVTSQREKAEHIAGMWKADADRQHRSQALALVRTAASVGEVLAQMETAYGAPPWVVATSARAESFAGCERIDPEELAAAAPAQGGILLLFGTGWGLDDRQITGVSRVLTPLRGRAEWNHLSVRSAVAVMLDRLFALAVPRTPT